MHIQDFIPSIWNPRKTPMATILNMQRATSFSSIYRRMTINPVIWQTSYVQKSNWSLHLAYYLLNYHILLWIFAFVSLRDRLRSFSAVPTSVPLTPTVQFKKKMMRTLRQWVQSKLRHTWNEKGQNSWRKLVFCLDWHVYQSMMPKLSGLSRKLLRHQDEDELDSSPGSNSFCCESTGHISE